MVVLPKQGSGSVMIKIVIIAATFALTGCSFSKSKAIDAENDLDCATVFLTAEKNEGVYNASESEKRAIFAFRTWYFTKIRKDQVAEYQKVVELIRKNPDELAPALKECGDRAMKDPEFERWASFANKNS